MATTKYRPVEFGTFSIGSGAGYWAPITIPPKTKEFKANFFCDNSCLDVIYSPEFYRSKGFALAILTDFLLQISILRTEFNRMKWQYSQHCEMFLQNVFSLRLLFLYSFCWQQTACPFERERDLLIDHPRRQRSWLFGKQQILRLQLSVLQLPAKSGQIEKSEGNLDWERTSRAWTHVSFFSSHYDRGINWGQHASIAPSPMQISLM